MDESTIYTIGHGTRTIEDFTAALESARIATVIDVRRFPGSRRNPQFSRENIESSLQAFGIAYEWWGESLGGRRSASRTTRHPAWRNAGFRGYADFMDTEQFVVALDELRARVDKAPHAVMCAETLWWKCHRRLIADALELKGVHVEHIIAANNTQRHKLHPAVRPDEQSRPVYDVGETPPLV